MSSPPTVVPVFPAGGSSTPPQGASLPPWQCPTCGLWLAWWIGSHQCPASGHYATGGNR